MRWNSEQPQLVFSQLLVCSLCTGGPWNKNLQGHFLDEKGEIPPPPSHLSLNFSYFCSGLLNTHARMHTYTPNKNSVNCLDDWLIAEEISCSPQPAVSPAECHECHASAGVSCVCFTCVYIHCAVITSVLFEDRSMGRTVSEKMELIWKDL